MLGPLPVAVPMAGRSVPCRILALLALALVILASTARPAAADCAQLDCDDGNPCTNDSCSDPDGCAHTNANGVSCSDGNACTLVDVCSGGACTGGSPKNCSDGNPCTTDTCDPGTGTCGHADNTASCSDNDACTIGDVCGGGTCQPGTPRVCSDSKECTDDSCHPVIGCVFSNDDTNTCSDTSACTTGDHCTNGQCVGTPVTCSEDADPCTTAICQPGTGCGFVFNTASCDDGDACTLSDVCSGGACTAGAPKNCSDANPCTTDTCDAGTGTCGHANNTASCSDDDACTVGDVCGGGSCQPGTPLVCDDSKECTDDSCHPIVGCVFANDDANTCSDSDLCTTADRCANGICVGDTLTCPDDGNVCTTAACESATGCVQLANTASCDDGDACTAPDQCSAGTCVGTAGACATCPALPSEHCLEARPKGSTIALKDAANPRRDTLAWRWQSPIAMTPGDLGDPTVDAGLLLCVYDQTAGVSTLAVSVDLPPGGTCGRRPCWKMLRNGSGYKRAAKGELGGASFRFKAGATKAGFALAAGGPELAMPPLPLRKDPRVIVELHRTDQPACWSARYETVKRVKAGAFKAVSE